MFRDAGIGHAIEMLLEELFLVLTGQIAVTRNPAVMVVRDEIVNVLFQIRAGATDGMNFVLTDHLRKGEPHFRRTHRARQGDQHATAIVQQFAIRHGGVFHHGGVEMPIMFVDEFRNRSCGHATLVQPSRGQDDKANPFFFPFEVCVSEDQRNDPAPKTSTWRDEQKECWRKVPAEPLHKISIRDSNLY